MNAYNPGPVNRIRGWLGPTSTPSISIPEPAGITTGPDGALWFTEYSGKMGRITTTGQVRYFPLPPF